MRAVFADAAAALRGLTRLLGFKPDWRGYFDISVDGVVRSFGAALLALPAYALFVLAANYFVAGNAPQTEAYYTAFEAALSYLRIWIVFPLVAAFVTVVLGVKHRFAAWLVVHNWTVFALLHVFTLFFVLYAAGLADAAALALMVQFYQLARLLVHWRVACAALQLGPLQGAAAAAIPILAEMVVIYAFG